jgi:cytochrome c2
VFALPLAACVPASPDPLDPALHVERGRQLLERYHCGTCHSIPGVAASQGQLAASLGAYGRRSYIAGRVANEPAALARWIADPSSIVPGTLMPSMGVAPADARDMAAYLGQLP